jgi:hypothetical protein
MKISYRAIAAVCLALFALPLPAQKPPLASDIPAGFVAPNAGYDYVKRVEMVPMRDGVKLYTVIVTPKGAAQAYPCRQLHG